MLYLLKLDAATVGGEAPAAETAQAVALKQPSLAVQADPWQFLNPVAYRAIEGDLAVVADRQHGISRAQRLPQQVSLADNGDFLDV